jgi:hypothetical protein
VACPGADTCNLAVTQSRGLADAIGSRLDEEGLAEVGGVRTNISGCTNSCGQHHIADIGFSGPSAGPTASPPRLQMLLGGYVGEEQIHFGERALRLPAKNAPEAAVRVVRRFAEEREAGESFRGWIDASGGAKAMAADLKDLDVFPTPTRPPTSTSTTARPALRGRGRRLGVRDLMALTESSIRSPASPPAPEPASTWPDPARPVYTDDELAELSAEFEKVPAVQDHPLGGRQLLPPPRHDGLDDRRRADRPGHQGRPGSRSSSSTPATTSPRPSRPSRRCVATTASTSG